MVVCWEEAQGWQSGILLLVILCQILETSVTSFESLSEDFWSRNSFQGLFYP